MILALSLSVAACQISVKAESKIDQAMATRFGALVDQKKYDEAFALIDPMVKTNDIGALALRAYLNKRLGKTQEAIKDFKVMAEKGNTCEAFQSAARELSTIYLEVGNEEEALKTFDNFVTKYPLPESFNERASFFEARGRLYEALGDRNKIVELLRKKMNDASKDDKEAAKKALYDALKDRAELHNKLGNDEKMLTDADELVALFPDQYGSYSIRSDYLEKAGKIEEALKDLDKMIELEVESALKTRANFCVRHGKAELAASDYAKIIETAKAELERATDDAAKSSAYRELAETYLFKSYAGGVQKDCKTSLADLKIAIENYKKSLSLASDTTKFGVMSALLSAHYDSYKDNLELGQKKEALADLESGLEIFNQYKQKATGEESKEYLLRYGSSASKLTEARAYLNLELGNNDAALADMNSLVKDEPSNRLTRAKFYEKTGKFDLAEADYLEMVSNARKEFEIPPSPSYQLEDVRTVTRNRLAFALDDLAQYYLRRGENDKALKASNEVLAFYPDSIVSSYTAAKALVKLKDNENAAKAFEKLASIKNQDMTYLWMMGEALVELKKYDAAVDLLNRSLNYNGKYEARVLRARAHMGLGNSGKAREDLVHVVETISKNKSADEQDKDVMLQAKNYLNSIK